MPGNTRWSELNLLSISNLCSKRSWSVVIPICNGLTPDNTKIDSALCQTRASEKPEASAGRPER